MGRGVRSNEDHCVVFLLGPRLAQLTVDPRSFNSFSPATQAQLKLSRQMAAKMDNLPIGRIIDTAKQALTRDPHWVALALKSLRKIPPVPGHVRPAAIAEREAFVQAQNGNPGAARDTIAAAVGDETNDAMAGVLLELQATYADMNDPQLAQQTIALARARNTNVTKPLGGLAYTPLDAYAPQVKTCTERLSARYSTAAELRLDVESIVEDLVFDEYRVEQFEEAMRRAGILIGLGSQRPEHDTDKGPDNLWALGDNVFWVIEAKTGAKSPAIGKTDMGQLAISMLWFGQRYDPQARPIPVMVHQSVIAYGDATPVTGMRLITKKLLGEFAAALRAFAAALADASWTDPEVVGRLLDGHGLTAAKLEAFTVPQRGVKKGS